MVIDVALGCEIFLLPSVIFVVDGDVVVTVRPFVLMEEADGVTSFVLHSLLRTCTRSDTNYLLVGDFEPGDRQIPVVDVMNVFIFHRPVTSYV